MASRKKQEDKHLKILKELVSQPNNKKCFDCGQRGPTYVNMTIGAFVCTSCSGLLRGLNPPHRIKSISMATFSATEIEFLQKHGNEACRSTWLALWDSSHPPEPESRDEQKVKDFLIKKYERKVWYSNQPKQKPAPQIVQEAKPLKHLAGENGSDGQASSISQPMQNQLPKTQPQVQVEQKKPAASGFDLLGDLGGDPFGASQNTNAPSQGFAAFDQQPQQPQQPPFGGQFIPFANKQQPQQPAPASPFGSTPQSTPFGNQPQQQSMNSTDPFGAVTPPAAASSLSFDAFGQTANPPSSNASNGGLDLFGGSQSTGTAVAHPSGFDAFGAPQSKPAALPQGMSESDRYKALSELDDVFRTSNTQSVFSSSSGPNAQGPAANQHPNPFMSPASGASGIAMFQKQQQMAQNPFDTAGANSQGQSGGWGAMSQPQTGGNAFQKPQQQQQQQQFNQGGFPVASSLGGGGSAFSGNQGGFGGGQVGVSTGQVNAAGNSNFGNQFGAGKAVGFGANQGQTLPQQQGGFGVQPQNFGGQGNAFGGQQNTFGNAQQNTFGQSSIKEGMNKYGEGQQPQNMFAGGQQNAFAGGQQGFANQQGFGTQQGFAGQQAFGGQQQFSQQQGFAGPQSGGGQNFGGQQQSFGGQQAFNAQQQGFTGQPKFSGQQNFTGHQGFGGQSSGFPTANSGVQGGFGAQQQLQQQQQQPAQQQFGSWGQTNTGGAGSFGMGGNQASLAQKSTNPFM